MATMNTISGSGAGELTAVLTEAVAGVESLRDTYEVILDTKGRERDKADARMWLLFGAVLARLEEGRAVLPPERRGA